MSTCLPKMVKLKATPPGHKSAVWSYFSLLNVPIRQKLDASIKTSPMKMNFGSAPRYKKFTHVCMLCLEMVKGMADRHNTSWSKSLCTITKTSNAMRHLTTRHSTHADVIAMLIEKKASLDSKGSLDSIGYKPQLNDVQIKNAMNKQSKSNLIRLQAKRLILNNI